MQRYTRWASYILLALVVGSLYAVLSIKYNDVLLLHDGAFVFMQMLEFWRGNLFDPLHINYSYCGILAHAVISFLGLFLPIGWATMMGGAITLLIGFYFLQKIFSSEKKILCLLVLLLPMPSPFGWLFSAGGEYFAAVCFICVAGYLLAMPQFTALNGQYHALCFSLFGVAGGFAVYSYLPNAILVLAAVMTVSGLNSLQMLHTGINRAKVFSAGLAQAKNLLCFSVAFLLGYLPHILGLIFFSADHLSSPPNYGLSFDLSKIALRFVDLYKTLGRLFSPVTLSGLEKLDLQKYINLVAADFILAKSALGSFLAIGLSSLFFFYALRFLCSSSRTKGFPLFLVIACLGTVAAYTLVPLQNFSKYDSRLFVAYYFMVCLGILYCSGKTVARVLSGGLALLLIYSCVNILTAHKDFDATKDRETSCASLTSAQIFSFLQRINPPAIAGSYRDIVPVAAVLKQTIVLDLSENKFRHTNEQFRAQYAIILASNDKDRKKIFGSKLSSMLRERSGVSKLYLASTLSHYDAYFEVMPSEVWDKFLADRHLAPQSSWITLVNELVKPFGKTACTFVEVQGEGASF